ncbi:MAG: mRNA surveillance protein pelota [Thermoplasmatales archaeon]|nr:mRNA surveillance protein pelota [Thermoplasmatales archaeon]
MRLLGKNPSDGTVSLQIESDDDVWHLFNVLEEGDLVTASTTRREEKAADKIRAERGEKRRMTLGIRVTKISFSDSDMRLNVLGTIETGPQDIGQHHTLMFETGDRIKISKRWKQTQLGRIDRAVEDSLKPSIAFVSLDQDEASIAVMRQYGLKEIASIKSGRSGKMYGDGGDPKDYHSEILAALATHVEPGTPLVLLGPGFEKETLLARGKEKDPAMFERSFVYHTGHPGMQGINELLKKGMGSDVLRESRVGTEMEAVERLKEEIGRDGLATYGPNEVMEAARAGAVETLLVSDAVIREGDLDGLVRTVEEQRGKVLVVSSHHDAGAELAAIGGLAALLRYKTV